MWFSGHDKPLRVRMIKPGLVLLNKKKLSIARFVKKSEQTFNVILFMDFLSVTQIGL